MSRTTGFRVILALMLFASLLPTGFSPSVQTAQANGVPTIQLSGEDTYTAQVGETVPFSVTGFPANTWLVIQFEKPVGRPVRLANALTDANGSAGGTIKVPVAAGDTDHVIAARGEAARDSAILRINPGSLADLESWGDPIWPAGAWQNESNPTRITVASGDGVRFHFSGLNPAVTYSLFRWDGDQSVGSSLSSVQATSTGFSSTLAGITNSGVYGLADAGGNRVTTTAILTVAGEVPPVIAYANPSTVVAGSYVPITVSGFLGNWDIEVSFEDGSWTKIGQTNGAGSGSGLFEVPQTPQGGKTLGVRTGAVERTIIIEVIPTIFTGRESTFDFWTRFTGLGVPVDVSYFDGANWIALGTATPDGTGFAVLEWQIGMQPSGTMPVRAVSNGVTILIADALVMTPAPLPPVAIILGGDVTVQATESGSALVALDGNESYDLDGSLSEYAWEIDSGSGRTNLEVGEEETVSLPIGQHTVYLTVTDTDELTDETSITVTVTGTAEPAAELALSRATVSTNVGFDVSGFPASSGLAVTLNRPGLPTRSLATVSTSSTGEFSGSFAVPAVPGGLYSVRFAAGSTTIDLPFEVAPRISPTPKTATPGQTISLNLRGFAANDDVLIRWRIGSSFVTIGSARTTSTGSLTNKLIVVPVNASAGPNTIRVQGTINQQSSAVTVIIPGVVLSTSRTTVNNSVGYSLTDFPANSSVSITWRRLSGSTIDLGTVTTDGYGAVTGFLKVPATPGGTGQLITFSSGTVTVNVPFEVAPRVKAIPASLSPGEVLNVSLRGFARQEAVVIRWRPGTSGAWTTIGSGATSSTGSANILITVPQNAVSGGYQLRAETPSFNAQTSVLTINPAPGLNTAGEETPTPTPEPDVETTPEPTTEPIATPEPTDPVGTPEPTVEPLPTEETTPTATPEVTPEATETPAPADDTTPTVEPSPTSEETPAP